MEKKEQKEFIITMVNNVKDTMLSKLDRLPDNWDGSELRYWIRDNFDSIVWSDRQDKRNSSYRKYNNDCIVRGL